MADKAGDELTPEQRREREREFMRQGLTAALAVAIVVAAYAAWTTVHPLAGAILAAGAAAAWWATETGRQHTAETSVRMAEASARGRRPLDASFDDDVDRPVPPWTDGDR